ncbi:helix-turn-helix transcriptional regulator [Pseudoflavonifractor capillosus]|uniref:helix-turn-helix domain-containing protein n=1 Tax=Pseudoflavonifractor capillosus TaxID=106588 RepID=UPI0019571C8A|nr:helix-turn-helix transcriptional regulator [Pseudoflavonifractor capillosus]MBM6897918.1 helix-turn-helix transcriptional regulator [Pseudoflavonifractor capillosus]
MTKTLGARIAALRKEKGMTQLELAQQMGVTDKAVSKWERDLSCPDINTIPRLAEVLGVSLEDLMQIYTPEKQEHEVSIHLSTIARAVALAMGVAVVVLLLLGELTVLNGMGMLGIGVACSALAQFDKRN